MRRLLIAAFLVVLPAEGQAQKPLEAWETASGQCAPSDIAVLKRSSETAGFTVAIEPAEVLTASGLSPAPVSPSKSIPAMTPLSCHARDGDKILVSSEDAGSSGFCGWISQSKTLAGSTPQASSRPESVLIPGSSVCREVTPLLVRDYCRRLTALGKSSRECSFPWIRDSPFHTKFLVWNTNARGGGMIESIEVPLYRSADAPTKDAFRSVKVFNVLRVFDLKPGPGGALRYLVGPSHTRMEGWIDESAGTVWYSQLTTFFTKDNNRQILFDEPSVRPVRPLAQKPSNISDMLNARTAFRRYPVLVDNRLRTPRDPASKRPHLEVAFIGSFCQDGPGMCATGGDGPDVGGDVQALERADILFLIDATSSMQPYFGLVAEAVEVVAKEYRGSPDYQFGVALYGDHTTKGRTQLDDALQFRYPIELKPLSDGTEFALLKNEAMYLDDRQSDREEATFAALLKAIETTPWRGNEPRFIIHVADAGDRIRQVPPRVLKALQDKRIIYMPVAVRGTNDARINALFVEQSKEIFARHRTPSGYPMGVEVQVTYSGASSSPRADYDGIARALNSAVSVGKDLREKIMQDLLRRSTPVTGATATRSTLLPPGHGEMLKGVEELLGIKVNARVNFPIAAAGYVETAEIGQPESNWEYFAAIAPPDIQDLHRAFGRLCGRIKETTGRTVLEEALRDVIKVLTGDQFKTQAEFRDYFNSRDRIPLSTQTMLGPGLIDLAQDMISADPKAAERVSAYQKEVCRTEVLLRVINGSQRLSRPTEGQDLTWDDKKSQYLYRNAIQFDWIFKDDFGVTTTYLPLTYLPRAVGKQ